MSAGKYCSTCQRRGAHANGCPYGDEPLVRPERDPDEAREEALEKEFDYEDALGSKCAARERMIEAWRLKR